MHFLLPAARVRKEDARHGLQIHRTRSRIGPGRCHLGLGPPSAHRCALERSYSAPWPGEVHDREAVRRKRNTGNATGGADWLVFMLAGTFKGLTILHYLGISIEHPFEGPGVVMHVLDLEFQSTSEDGNRSLFIFQSHILAGRKKNGNTIPRHSMGLVYMPTLTPNTMPGLIGSPMPVPLVVSGILTSLHPSQSRWCMEQRGDQVGGPDVLRSPNWLGIQSLLT